MIPIPGAVQVVAGIAAVALVGGLIASYNSGQQAKARLEQCAQANEELRGQISRQNDAVLKLQQATQAASERAAKALGDARKASVATETERARLGRLQAELRAVPAKDCPAGKAVSAVREGLTR